MPDEILASDAPKICVIAAPGSGKTKRILIPMAAQILSDQAVSPRNVLLLTFSRLSAKDLKERVADMGDRAPRATTVHGLCLAFLLSENDHDMRNRVESILLDFEKDTLLCDLKLVFPQRDKRDLARDLKAFSAGWAVRPHDEVFEETDDQRRFKAAIVRWLGEQEAAMMEEIVCGAVALAQRLGNSDFITQPRHILVDEYQDLNRLEQKFVNILARESDLLLVVGDPNQSIYGFKFSYPEGITDFSRAEGVSAWSSMVTGRCPRSVVSIANQLIIQADPGTANLLEALRPDEGEVHFVQKNSQHAEFQHVVDSISARLRAGVTPDNLIVLSPKRKLGADFVEYFNANKVAAGIPEAQSCVFESKQDLSEAEQERVLLFGLLVKPDSLLRIRTYLGIGDDTTRAAEIATIKQRYGNLTAAMRDADPEHFPRRSTRVRRLCQRIIDLRAILAEHNEAENVNAVVDELFPEEDLEMSRLRKVVKEIAEDGDTLVSLYAKFSEYLRSIPTDNATIRVMTLMASKGLEADHVYIIGCNAGNLPGENRSVHMTDAEYIAEQRRFLFVGVTRARVSLTISWARHIPFGQARQHHTGGLGPRRVIGAPVQMVVGISPFLADLHDVHWEA